MKNTPLLKHVKETERKVHNTLMEACDRVVEAENLLLAIYIEHYEDDGITKITKRKMEKWLHKQNIMDDPTKVK